MPELIKNIFRWIYWYPFRFVIQRLPLKQVYRLCSVLALLLYILTDRAKAIRNEALLLLEDKLKRDGKDGLEAVVYKSLANYVHNEIEVLCFPSLNKGNIKKAIKYVGIENLDRALGEGRGVMLLFAHFGANQMIMPAIGYLDYKMNQVGASPLIWNQILKKNTFMQRKTLEIRWELEQTLPVTYIDPFSSIKKVFTCLKNNEILGMAIDGGAGKNKLPVEFLGQKIFISPGAIKIALRTKCCILPTFMLRGKSGFNTLIIEPPLIPPKSKEKDVVITETMHFFVQRLELYVCKHPCHYLNFLALRRAFAKAGEPAFPLEK